MGCGERIAKLKSCKWGTLDELYDILEVVCSNGKIDAFLSKRGDEITIQVPQPGAVDIDGAFEYLWNIYPRRNGLRVGKGEAKKYFKTHFKSKKKRDLLEKAIINYTAVDVFPRDMKRFMLNDFYMDFLEAAKDQGMTYEAVIKHCADNDLKSIGEHYAMAGDNLWYPLIKVI